MRFAAALLIGVVLSSCGGDSRPTTESAVAGDVTVLVDEEIRPLLDSILIYHARENPKAHISVKTLSASAIMHTMIDRSERVAIVARDYTHQEDSLMSTAQIDTVSRAVVARDALVFFVAKSFPYDTMNAEHIRQWLGGKSGVGASYPKLKSSPVFVVPGGSAGSVYGNISNVVLRGGQPSSSMLATVSTLATLFVKLRAIRILSALDTFHRFARIHR